MSKNYEGTGWRRWNRTSHSTLGHQEGTAGLCPPTRQEEKDINGTISGRSPSIKAALIAYRFSVSRFIPKLTTAEERCHKAALVPHKLHHGNATSQWAGTWLSKQADIVVGVPTVYGDFH